MARDEAELGIIAAGREEYVKSLRSQCEREVALLQSQRDSNESEKERVALTEQTEAVRQQFADRIGNSRRSLF